MVYELHRIWKEVVLAYFRHSLRICLAELTRDTRNVKQDCLCFS
jgi:hypothetical protein